VIELLVLDVGNTTVTAAWMAGGEAVERAVFPHANGLEGLTMFASVRRRIPAAVVGVNEVACARAISCLGDRLVRCAPTDFRAAAGNRCDPPESVGQDRLFNAAGVTSLPAVVVDAGTAITVDLVTADASGTPVFQGGSIAPGVGLSFRALHENTGRLPLVAPLEAGEVSSRGTNTEDAIRCGVVRGLAGLVERLVREVAVPPEGGGVSPRGTRPFGSGDRDGSGDGSGDPGRRRWRDGIPVTYLTGGDAALLQPYLDGDFVLDPDLMLRGIAVSACKAGGSP